LIFQRQAQRRKSIRADFMQSIRSRLMVFQVVQAIRVQSLITFDFVVLVTIARFDMSEYLSVKSFLSLLVF
jgi:hypothetical protein